jgi:hypothetical protein
MPSAWREQLPTKQLIEPACTVSNHARTYRDKVGYRVGGMFKGLTGAAFLAMACAGIAHAQGPQRDPLNGQFGVMEAAMAPADAADDAIRMGEALSKLPAQRPGVVDAYVLTASFWNEPVFENEAKEAASILARRYDAAERTITLSAGRGQGQPRVYPSASPNNFNAALGRIGKLADPNEDIVIVFFTSHGGQDGAVAIQEKNRMFGALRAQQLRASLQAANIKSKLVIVSACYSGYFILPFSNDDTVVLTAAAADKTSFGCEPSRDWTYFGDALFNHGLRGGAPLIDAFEQARGLITKWEGDLHARWKAQPVAARAQQPEPEPSNPQKNAGDSALARIAKAEAYGAAINCAGHLSYALDRARTQSGFKGFTDPNTISTALSAATARANTENAARGRSAQDTARAINQVATTALQLAKAQTPTLISHLERCMAP